MAITPATYNIRPQRRADYPFTVTFKDGSGSVVDLTGYTVLAQVWDKGRTVKQADFTVTIADPSNGQVLLNLSYTDTASLPDESYYDVMLIAPSGTREYYLQGVVRPSEGYTAPT